MAHEFKVKEIIETLKIKDCAFAALFSFNEPSAPLDNYQISGNYIKNSAGAFNIGIELHDKSSDDSFYASAVLKGDILYIESLPFALPTSNGKMDNPLLTYDQYLDAPATLVCAFQKIARQVGCSEIHIPNAENNPARHVISDLARLAHENNRSTGVKTVELLVSLLGIYHDYDYQARCAVHKIYDNTADFLGFDKYDGYWSYPVK